MIKPCLEFETVTHERPALIILCKSIITKCTERIQSKLLNVIKCSL